MNDPADAGLLSVLAAIPDPRGRKGRRHPLAAMLAAITCGILTGARGCTAIAQWINNQDVEFWHALGFTRRPPRVTCYRSLLLALPAETLENALRRWASKALGVDGEKLRPTALDGKTLCNTMQSHGQSIHLLALLDHETGGVLGQLKMPAGTNEHKAAMELLTSTCIEGRVITGDAMFCQRDLCQQIIDSGGDYLFIVKDNQSSLKETVMSEFRPGFSPLQRTPPPAAA